MRVVSAEGMRAIDRAAIEHLGIPGLVLMENAARGLVDALGERFADAESVALLCGPGNNGADGLAAARQLHARGYSVSALVVDGGGRRSEELELQLAICHRLGLDLAEPEASSAAAAAFELAATADVVVDALFGIGLSRPLDGIFAEVVERVALAATPVVAADIPSGLGGAVPEPLGPVLPASVTVTFGLPKVAHVLAPGSAICGELIVADLGFDVEALELEVERPTLALATLHGIAAEVEPRPVVGHKGTFGHLLVVSGAAGTSGAAVLAARAAQRSGAGLVTVATPQPQAPIVDAGSVESMTIGYPSVADVADVADASAAAAALEILRRALAGKAALAVGPGQGRDPASQRVIRELVLGADLPLVLDADGIHAFAGEAAALRARRAPTLLTPHPGELARLVGGEVARTSSERLRSVRRAAEESGAVVVLKGHESLVADPDGSVTVNPTGNDGMATGGSGDVLTGVVGGLLAQGYATGPAARLGVFLHGLAGDLAAEELGRRALVASDVVDRLAAAWREIEDV